VDGVSSLTDSPESLKWALKERDVKIARLEAKVKELEGKAPGNPVLGGTVTNDLGNHPYTTPEPNLITLRPYDAPDKGAISTWTVGEVAPMDKPEGKPITANPEAATEVLTPEEGKMARKYLRALNSDLGTTTSWIELGRMVAVGSCGVVGAPVVEAKGTEEIVREERARPFPETAVLKILGPTLNPHIVAVQLQDGRRCSMKRPPFGWTHGFPKGKLVNGRLEPTGSGVYRMIA